ncbi:MAG: hypothetical protein R3229_10055, partial [Alphaproteobacteria bacterium]|nr:hypothetical protein [Alphaproteobacteria bacterium]
MRGHSKLGVHTIAMVLTLGGLILAPVRLAAAQSQQSETVQRLVDELRAIVTQGEKRRAADPRFLDELKGLADKYDWPWRRVVFRERFRDGDYARDPSWVVAVGRFWVDAQLGLRTRVEPFTREQPPAQTQSDSQDLFGAVLRELARPKGDDQGSQDQRKAPSTPSEIFTNARIGNAFALRLRLRTVTDIPARIEFGPYQGPARKEGYRLVYHNREGSGPVFELVRLRPWGSSVIFALDRAPRLDDG